MNYTVWLALEDFLPVIFSTIGLFILARMIGAMDKDCAPLAYLGWIFTAIGGFGKATWKLLNALSVGQTNIRFMDDGLFFWLAISFIFIAFALWYSQRTLAKQSRTKYIWLWPAIISAIAVITGIALYNPDREVSRVWFFVLLGMTTIFNLATLVLAMRQAKNQQQFLALALFVFNLIAVFALQGLARTGDRDETMQWVAQIINTMSQIGLLYGAWLLASATSRLIAKREEATLQPQAVLQGGD